MLVARKAITKLTYDTRPPESLLGIVSLSHTHDKTESIFRLVGYKFEMSHIHRFSVTTRFSYITDIQNALSKFSW